MTLSKRSLVKHADHIVLLISVLSLEITRQLQYTLKFNHFINKCTSILEVVNVAIFELIKVSETLVVKYQTHEVLCAHQMWCSSLQTT